MHRLDSGHFAVEDCLGKITSNIQRFYLERVVKVTGLIRLALYSKPAIFVVISVLVVAFIYSSYSRAFAEPADRNWGEGGGCDVSPDFNVVTCCWTEPDLYNPGELVTWCQSCDFYGENCGPVQLDRIRTGPFAPPQGDGVLQQPPSEGEGGILPLTRSQSVLLQDSVLQQQQQQQRNQQIKEQLNRQQQQNQLLRKRNYLCQFAKKT